jgi:hypothetical protein
VVRRARLDVRIHAQRDGRDPHGRRQLRERAQLAFALDVEGVDAGVERGRQLVIGLADAAEDNAVRRDAGEQRAVQLAATHDVGAGAGRRAAAARRGCRWP